MKRLFGTLALASAFAVAAVYAQESTTRTVTKTDENAKTVTYTGCVGAGTQTRTYTLNHIVPLSRTTTTESTNGGAETVTTTTTYALVPTEKVELQPMLGHKVEVTGMFVRAGNSKTVTETKTEREGGPDSKTVETTKSEGGMPEFRVISVKHLADSCQ
jgi:hypothetical protein